LIGASGKQLSENPSRLSDEALYMAAYLCIRFTMDLTVLSIGKDPQTTASLIQRARKYLESMHFSKVNYIEEIGDPSQTILKISDDINCDAILMGGYESGVFKELLFGSTVDRVLNKTNRLFLGNYFSQTCLLSSRNLSWLSTF